jgi:hypothetical protein
MADGSRQGGGAQELRYDRIYRTPSSESYLLSRAEQPLGRLELHFAQSAVYALLLLESDLAGAELERLIAQIDEDLVWTASVAREDFIVAVYAGRELGVWDDAARQEGTTPMRGRDRAR